MGEGSERLMGHRTPEFSYDELLEALDFLWMEMDHRLREDFTRDHPDLDKYLYKRNDDGEPT